jgi:ribonuclease BN (tRNA processing enzyme)
MRQAPVMNEMTVRLLGCGDAFGSGGRFQTCIHVQGKSGQWLIDCGASSLIAMKRFGIDPSALESVLISHLHGDHFGGLPFLLLDAQFVARRTRPLVIAGPPGLAARLEAALEVLFPGSSATAWRFELQVIELPADETAMIGLLAVTPSTVVHASGAPAYALRLACDGKTLAYSGDTEWTEALREAARDADVFICEAYTYNRKFPYHLDYQTLLAHREELGCHRLVLTHLGDDMLARLTDLTVEVARDGMVITI